MNTKMWGPPGWKFLHTITFNYPIKIDHSKKEQKKLSKDIRSMFENLKYTLPCKYCRVSFEKFLKELPIEPFLGCEKALTYWFYCMHNKVNCKLRGQEWELFVRQLEELLITKEGKKDSLMFKSVSEKSKKIKRLKEDVLFTKLDPPYESVCAFYESHRAGCHPSKNKINSCRL